MKPIASIIIPMHNAARFIGQAIESLHEQRLEDWELIVVDDGSTDGGPGLVERFCRADARIMLLRLQRGGPGAARNHGIEAARGDFLHFLDADDYMLPGGLDVLLQAAERNRWGASFGGYELIDERGASLDCPRLEACDDVGLDEHLAYCRFGVHQQVIRRDTLGDLRFASEGAEEVLPLWFDLALRGVRWTNCRSVVCAYRTHDAGRSRDFLAGARSNIDVLRRAFVQSRSCAWAAGSLDLSDDRLAAREHRIAFDYAHMAVLPDPTPMKDRAWATLMLAPPRSTDVSPRLWSETAYRVLPIAAYSSSKAWLGDIGGFASALSAWWGRLEREGLMPRGFEHEARAELARLIVEGAAGKLSITAERIAEAAASRPRVELLGLGQNGRAVASALHRRGIEVVARDDALATTPDGKTVIDDSRIAVQLRAMNEPFEAGVLYIITPLDDERILARVPAWAASIRWRAERERLGAELESRLIESWPRQQPLRSAA